MNDVTRTTMMPRLCNTDAGGCVAVAMAEVAPLTQWRSVSDLVWSRGPRPWPTMEKQMITTTLIPLDGSLEAEQAVPYALAMLPAGGEIVLLHVTPVGDLLPELLEGLAAVPGELDELEVARALLEQVKADRDDPRFQWRSQVVHGNPAAEILRAITHNKTDLVVMTTHGRGALGRAVFGSVADRIARSSPVPVLLVRPRPAGERAEPVTIRRLVVPLDGSDLAEAALPVAIELGTRLEQPVHLVRVVNLAASLMPGGSFGMPALSPELSEEGMERAHTEARDYLAAVARRLQEGGGRVTWETVEGSPFFSLAEATSAEDLVVMTSHGRSGVVRWLLGSVAEKLVREAPGPVLLVPSAGRGITG